MISEGRMVCPKCGTDTTFTTTAHVMQEWEVDPEGIFIKVSEDCLDVDNGPDPENIWVCTKCGSEGHLETGGE